jgi:hypothetical protein
MLWAFLLWEAAAPTRVWPTSVSATPKSETTSVWQALVEEAKTLGLPTRFLSEIPASFVKFEFEDLRAFAAEYHPGEHRMVLNRALSLNAAGRTLRPLARLPHKDVETLYHELFHAYLDFLEQSPASAAGGFDLLRFARDQQQCRYQHVFITPVPQKKLSTEERFLSERESWEALNETWALFVGWSVWSRMEAQATGADRVPSSKKTRDAWLSRLKKAEAAGDLTGYYEPESAQEKAVAQKRFLAPAFRISLPEVVVLMSEALGMPPEYIQGAEQILVASSAVSSANGSCSSPPAL